MEKNIVEKVILDKVVSMEKTILEYMRETNEEYKAHLKVESSLYSVVDGYAHSFAFEAPSVLFKLQHVHTAVKRAYFKLFFDPEKENLSDVNNFMISMLLLSLAEEQEVFCVSEIVNALKMGLKRCMKLGLCEPIVILLTLKELMEIRDENMDLIVEYMFIYKTYMDIGNQEEALRFYKFHKAAIDMMSRHANDY